MAWPLIRENEKQIYQWECSGQNEITQARKIIYFFNINFCKFLEEKYSWSCSYPIILSSWIISYDKSGKVTTTNVRASNRQEPTQTIYIGRARFQLKNEQTFYFSCIHCSAKFLKCRRTILHKSSNTWPSHIFMGNVLQY